MIKERLSDDLKNAMKSGNTDLVSTLRFLISQIQNEEIKKRGQGGDGTLSDEAISALLKGEVKRRNEAIQMFKDGKRDDLVFQEEKAVTMIRQYLPPEMGHEEIVVIIRKLKDGGLSDFNNLMRTAMAELKGQADGKEVSEVVKEVLNG